MRRSTATIVAVAVALLAAAIGGGLLLGTGGSKSTKATPTVYGPPPAQAYDSPAPFYTPTPYTMPELPRVVVPPLTPPPGYVPVAKGAGAISDPPTPGAPNTNVGPAYNPPFDDSLEARVQRECGRGAPLTTEFQDCYQRVRATSPSTPGP
jgi:hypothetical protein